MTMRNSTVCSGTVSPDLLKHKEIRRGKQEAGTKHRFHRALMARLINSDINMRTLVHH